jgi:hypothetical protein
MRKLNSRLSLRRETLSDLTSPALAEAAGGTIIPVPRFPFSPLCVSTWPSCYCTIVV